MSRPLEAGELVGANRRRFDDRPTRARPKRYWETEEFADQQRVWYGRLQSEGFEDAENAYGDLRRSPHSERLTLRRAEASGLAEYMRQSGHWLWERVWSRRNTRRMWELHSEGMTRSEIADRMGTMPGHQPWYITTLLGRERERMLEWVRNGTGASE